MKSADTKVLIETACCALGEDEPDRAELARYQELLGDAHEFVAVFLNLRLVVQWDGFGVRHERLTRVLDLDTYTFDVRLFNPDSELYAVRSALKDAGCVLGTYRAYVSAHGGWLRITVPAGMANRLQASRPRPA